MKYLVKDLHVKSFCGYVFDDNEDKFIIGPLNNSETKIKDVITGQVVQAIAEWPLSALKTYVENGNYTCWGYLTGLCSDEKAPRQRLIARIISLYLKGDVVDSKQLEIIKHLMNNEIKRINAKKTNAKKQKLYEKLTITEEERDF